MMMDGLLIFNLVKRHEHKMTDGKSAIESLFSRSSSPWDECGRNLELQFSVSFCYYSMDAKQIDEWHYNCNIFDHSMN